MLPDAGKNELWPGKWFEGEFGLERREMVERHLAGRGVRDHRVVEAMALTPREEFVPPALRAEAYADAAMPAGCGQTISQPYIVAKTLELAEIEPGARVLEIGVGTGYQMAVILAMGARVWGVEIVPDLAYSACERLTRLGMNGFEIWCGDGRQGLPELAPFDAIVTAAAPLQTPAALLDQLRLGGRLVGPAGPDGMQELMVHEKSSQGVKSRSVLSVRFVPMTGVGEKTMRVGPASETKGQGDE